MEGLAPFLQPKLVRAGARVVHTYAVRGINVRALQRRVRDGLRIIPASLADEIPFVVVALSGNGAVTDPLELRSNLDWIRAEYPRALIAFLGHTITETGTSADQERARAAELEARIVPARRGFLWVDMRLRGLPLAGDRVHHTREGYRRLANHAWNQIVRATEDESSVPWPVIVLGAAAVGVAAAYGYRRWTKRNEEVEAL